MQRRGYETNNERSVGNGLGLGNYFGDSIGCDIGQLLVDNQDCCLSWRKGNTAGTGSYLVDGHHRNVGE